MDLTVNAHLAIWHDLLWCLVVFGITNIVVVSNLFERFRKLVYPVTTVFHCPMCLGFWVGGVLSYIWRSPTGNIFFDAILGSVASWMLYLLVMERQFKA